MTEPQQPDWIEVGTSQYGCGECSNTLLDTVYLYPDTDDKVVFLACPSCGWDERDAGEPTIEDEWFNGRYSG
jgi:DNA-directed RNA polymerase subunit RPC12/RpoP